VDELMSSLQAHEQKIVKGNGDKAIKHALQSKLSLNKWIYHSRKRSTKTRGISAISRKRILEYRIKRKRR